jgi:hypothetical protein
MKIQLVGARRYNVGGELFLSHKPDGRTAVVYSVEEDKGNYLLDQTDPQTGYPYFDTYTGEVEGEKPGMAQDEEKVVRQERPKENERQKRRRLQKEASPGEKRGFGPRGNEAFLQGARPGTPARMAVRAQAPIEDDPGETAMV